MITYKLLCDVVTKLGQPKPVYEDKQTKKILKMFSKSNQPAIEAYATEDQTKYAYICNLQMDLNANSVDQIQFIYLYDVKMDKFHRALFAGRIRDKREGVENIIKAYCSDTNETVELWRNPKVMVKNLQCY